METECYGLEWKRADHIYKLDTQQTAAYDLLKGNEKMSVGTTLLSRVPYLL